LLGSCTRPRVRWPHTLEFTQRVLDRWFLHRLRRYRARECFTELRCDQNFPVAAFCRDGPAAGEASFQVAKYAGHAGGPNTCQAKRTSKAAQIQGPRRGKTNMIAPQTSSKMLSTSITGSPGSQPLAVFGAGHHGHFRARG
jgi:hypothetical protein